MPSAKKGTRPVVIPVTFKRVAMWKCAAALEPVPPTWLTLTWADVLTTPVDWHRGRMTLDVPVGVLAKLPRRLETEARPEYLSIMLENHARTILDRHGLQCIPVPDRPQSDLEDAIPF